MLRRDTGFVFLQNRFCFSARPISWFGETEFVCWSDRFRVSADRFRVLTRTISYLGETDVVVRRDRFVFPRDRFRVLARLTSCFGETDFVFRRDRFRASTRPLCLRLWTIKKLRANDCTCKNKIGQAQTTSPANNEGCHQPVRQTSPIQWRQT